MAREMLINIAEGEECRIAVMENGVLEELYIERASLTSHVGNIYRGKVTNIEASIQAAFVDFGIGKNGFLHISDLHPRYFMRKGEHVEHIGRRKSLRERPPIQQCMKKSQDLIVQVIKEGVSTKGPTLTTYLSLPGKYLVMMPWMHKLGVSQKIEDDDERTRLRAILDEIEVPKQVGLILRTASQGCSKRDIQNDLSYITRLWKAIQKRMESESKSTELYRESDLVIRAMRDIFNSKISKIICDNESVARKIRDFLSIAQPRFKKRATYYDGKTPLFHKYKIEEEIKKIQSRDVKLKGGGSIVIEQTEAFVAIDVNSGTYRKQNSAEQTALKTNIEAAIEIARQLRLRDLGGLIICDFIDMQSASNRREVEKVFRADLKNDRARSKILRISAFGIIEMTRQRMRPSLQSSTYLKCPHCGGSGLIKSLESVSIEIIRLLSLAVTKQNIKRIELTVSSKVGNFLQNEKRSMLTQMEQDNEKHIVIVSEASYPDEQNNIVCFDEREGIVKF